MKVVIKKSRKSNVNLKLYRGIKHMELIRIYPKTTLNKNISEVRVKITPKKYKVQKENNLYVMKVHFSTKLLNELSWSKENKIAVFKDAKSINNYFLKIADDNCGFKINTTKDINYIQFTIDNIVDKYKVLTTVGFEITDGGLKIVL